MNLLYPRLTLRQFGWMFAFGLGGAVIAGLYGIVHDQITFEVGPEYFTEFKFQQFFYLPKTQPEWLIVAEIGFLATWWVGFFAGWFMGRLTIPRLPLKAAAKQSLQGVLVMMITAVVFAIVAFAQVGYIHNASYLGGLVGLIVALVWMKWRR